MRKLTDREKRVLILFSVFLMILAVDCWYRRWNSTITLESEHYIIYSAADESLTERTLNNAEILHRTYCEFMQPFLKGKENPCKLKLKLYRDRDEFKRCNRRTGWAEAYYRKPYCHQYIDQHAPNPYHWMIHEATHQLNSEVAKLKLSKWLNEGLASYFSTSMFGESQMQLGKIDINTYPVWWLSDLKLSGNLKKDIEGNKIISLDLILKDKQGPDIDDHFNTYYIHWWSLAHFCLHYNNSQYKDGFFEVIRQGGSFESFQKHIGPAEDIQEKWYQYLIEKIQNISS